MKKYETGIMLQHIWGGSTYTVDLNKSLQQLRGIENMIKRITVRNKKSHMSSHWSTSSLGVKSQ